MDKNKLSSISKVDTDEKIGEFWTGWARIRLQISWNVLLKS